jgi:hypothetical protein
MPELTASTREAARRLGVSDTAIHKAERSGRIAREPDGLWHIDKTRRCLVETADPVRSTLASRAGADGTPTGADTLRYFLAFMRYLQIVLAPHASIWCGAALKAQPHPPQAVEPAGTGVAAR